MFLSRNIEFHSSKIFDETVKPVYNDIPWNPKMKSGCCSEVINGIKFPNAFLKVLSVWTGGRYLEVVNSSGLTALHSG
jgi:hypothetical protein